jgi:hypothetical protein
MLFKKKQNNLFNCKKRIVNKMSKENNTYVV